MKTTLGALLLLLVGLPVQAQRSTVRSTLEIYDITSNDRQVVLAEDAHFVAPNWSTDGKYLIINQKGQLYKISLGGEGKDKIPIEHL